MYCQQLLSVVKLGGVCVPFGHKVKACTCSETYICIGYVLPTIVDVHLYWIYSANNCGVLFSWGLSVCPSSTRLGHLHVLRYIFVLDMFCQQLWGVVRFGGVHFLRYVFALDIGCQQTGIWCLLDNYFCTGHIRPYILDGNNP